VFIEKRRLSPDKCILLLVDKLTVHTNLATTSFECCTNTLFTRLYLLEEMFMNSLAMREFLPQNVE
jgi:hypothetical protein